MCVERLAHSANVSFGRNMHLFVFATAALVEIQITYRSMVKEGDTHARDVNLSLTVLRNAKSATGNTTRITANR